MKLAIQNYHKIMQLLLLSSGTVLSLFLLQAHQDFSLWDEGYLWYGVQRVMLGEVPIRDFMAYDPGRYYSSAALMNLYGDNGIIALRGTIAIFQTVGLFIGLALISSSTVKPNRLLLLLANITLVVWMIPRHKLFDISISIGLVGTLSFLIQQPASLRYFLTGLFVGIFAVFGRNHGLYGATGSLCVMGYLALGRDKDARIVKTLWFWAAGVVIGYLPILIMFAVVPGFAKAFWQENVLFVFKVKTTNLPLPIPWPWNVQFGQKPIIGELQEMLVGIFFIGIIVFGILGIAWSIQSRLKNKPITPVLTASIFFALPYAHFAYSRAEVNHLAQGIFPFLIGIFALLASQPAKIKWPFAMLLCGASLLVLIPFHPGWQCYKSQQCVNANVGGDKLILEKSIVSDLEMLKKISDDLAPGDRSFIVTPYWPGAYAILKRKSPIYEIYGLWPSSEAFQRAEIEKIKTANPGFAIIIDYPLDGRDELRFRNTHQFIYHYIKNNFEPLIGYTQNPSYQVYKSKKASIIDSNYMPWK